MVTLIISLAVLAMIACVSYWLGSEPKSPVPRPDGIFTPQNPECIPIDEISGYRVIGGVPLRDEVTDSRLDRIADAVEEQTRSMTIGEIVKAAEKPTPKRNPRPKKNWTKNKPNQ